MGWVAYNMNKRHARGLWCLKYDKKASMTNQSSGIGTWQDLRIGRLRRLQLDQSGKVFFRPGGEWVVGIGRRLAGKNDERATV